MVREFTESLICGLIGSVIMLLIVINSPVHETARQGASVSVEN